ncbi:small cell adhesion glycoprotein-like [Hoplias malabaricus]|uniref:small cell adhesion glycoprotein-like n=1 Tax=Hoplias malabaricus TaxID=27720 RepID=UPI003462618D
MATVSPSNYTDAWTTPMAPNQTDSAIIGVVIALVLCTLAVVAFLLYRYMCHNKGAYRTTGEPAPGVDPDRVYQDTVTENKKEYFI